MRRRKRVPLWFVPGLLCVAALGAAIQLKVHFDGMIARAAGATPAFATTAGDLPRLGSSPAAADFDDYVLVGASQADELADGDASQVIRTDASDEAEAAGETPPAGPQTSVGSSVAQIEDDFTPDETVWVDPRSSTRPWSALGATEGLLTFRGNPTRSYYGRGPVPSSPVVQWEHHLGCSNSPVAGEPKQWCGTGWTGQPAVFRLPTTGEWTVAFGAYNRNVNFLDPATGRETLPPYRTGDIIKGSVTVDPDGFPLLYSGSRDNQFHVVALDGPTPRVVWQLSSDTGGPTLWNNDWDGSALVINDHLFVGGENGRFYIVRLNRGYDSGGRVTIAPELLFSTESWDGDLLAAIGDKEVSIENSVAVSGDTVYFANSGGLVQGWNIAGLDDGEAPEQVFRFWTGDDTDASIVVDGDGMLYVGSQYQRLNARGREVGQIMKLDPSNPGDPLVWSRSARLNVGSGIWATPAIFQDLVIVATNEGELIGLDRESGADRWLIHLDGPLWSSPVIVDGTLVQGDCRGVLHAYDLDGVVGPDATWGLSPTERWAIELGGCIESTPAVWDGQIFVGTRSGSFYAIGDR